MADDRVRAVLSVVNDDYIEGFKKAINVAEDFNAKLKEHMNNVGNLMSIGGGAITAFGENAMKSYGNFEAQLNKAAVVAGGTSEDIKGLSDVANEMAKDLPLDAQEAGNAMVGMAQNGAGIKQIKDYFPPIAKASTAASADIGKTAEAVQQSMNIWGGSAKRNAAVLVQTANLSNAAIETMGDAFSNVGTNAHSLGMSIDVTSEAIGLLTNRGMSSARASMDLNHALVQMIKPSKSALGVMQQLGISYTDSSGRMKPFKQILQELNDALATYTPAQKQAALATLFGTAGEQAMLPLMEAVANKTGNASNSWDAYEKQMKKAAGTSKQAGKTLDSQASEMQKNIGSAIEQVGGSFDDLKNTAMQSQDALLRNTLNNIADMLNSLRTSHNSIAVITRDFIGLSPIIGPVVTAAGGFVKALASIGSIINPWTIFGGLLVVLAGRFIEIYNSSKPLRKAISDIGSAFKDAFGEPVQSLTTGVKDFFESISGKSKKTSSELSKIGGSLAKTIKKVNWNGVFTGLRTAFYDVIYTIQKFPWKTAFKTLQTAVKQVIKFVKDEFKVFQTSGMETSVKQIIVSLQSLAKNVLKNLKQLLPPLIADVRNMSKVLSPIVAMLGSFIAIIAKAISNILKANSALLKAHPALKQFEVAIVAILTAWAKWKKITALVIKIGKIINLFKKIRFGILGIIDTIKNLRSVLTVLNAIISANPYAIAIAAIVAITVALIAFFTKTKTGRKIISNFVRWFRNVWKGLSKWFKNVWTGLSKFLSNIWNGIKSVASAVFGAIGKVIQFEFNLYRAIIKGVWGATIGWVINNFKRMFNLIKDIFTHGRYYMTHPVQLAKKIIGTQIEAIKDLFKSLGLINLWNAGAKVIGGFINGLKSVWENGKKFVGGIANWIKEHKGPIEYDAVLLEPAGNAIMSGLNKGLQNKFRDVQATIAGITDNIANSAQTIPDAFNEQLNDFAVNSRLSLQTSLQNQQIQLDRQPAQINLNLGGHNYSTFVRDVTTEQDKQFDLERRR